MPISVATPRFSLPLRVDDSSLSLRAHASRPMTFTSSVRASPPMVAPSQWSLNQRHILMLNVIACAVAISASWLFFSAIPTILAFKKAAESLEKLLDVTREELPDTMAAVRLSGMEISDLTMELSDLGQEITRGVRSSTRAVRVAEDGIRHLTNINATGNNDGTGRGVETSDIKNGKKPTKAKASVKDGRLEKEKPVTFIEPNGYHDHSISLLLQLPLWLALV
ncbi:hypothetical protein AMTR_s00010p00240940 [Amborella trichopoda]|uniref:Uncharacterized protein n=1 Tax=Amborella trichopoda TaxID=13333 RepID=W1NGP1_AMBTC|nr:hypothetical protein AMTR_s00010p00240940 [Amborella trichopoda]